MRDAISTNAAGIRSSVTGAALTFLFSFLSIGCGNWAEFGNGPTNEHRSHSEGPISGISTKIDLIAGGVGGTFQQEVGVLVDYQGDYYVSSYDSEIQVYNHAGIWAGAYDLGFDGPRAAPYVSSFVLGRYATIFTGAVGGAGGFHAIRVDKYAFPYTLSLMDSDWSTGPSESSPKRADDGTFYICDLGGEVHRYTYVGGTLTHNASLSLGHEVRGAIALYDADPRYSGQEVLVATTDGLFFVLDKTLSTVIWSDASGVGPLGADNYYAGVTVAERGIKTPVALLPIAGDLAGNFAANSGKVRAIDLHSRAQAWELTPSFTNPGFDSVEGSVAVLLEQNSLPGEPGDGSADGSGTNTVDIGEDGGETILPPTDPNSAEKEYHATFASTDGFLYGVDIVTGNEIWSHQMTSSGFDAPVVDDTNVIYVGDGRSVLHAVQGDLSCAGCLLWTDVSLASGGSTDIVKLGVTNKNALVVGTGNQAYAVFQ